jgi:hypothetical protein
MILVAAAAIYTWTLLAAVGLLPHGSARTSNAFAYEYQTGHKVTMCHRGHTILVDDSAVPAHQHQGDTLGPCK